MNFFFFLVRLTQIIRVKTLHPSPLEKEKMPAVDRGQVNTSANMDEGEMAWRNSQA